jgi:eukaryotic-like serine/threonine-protein kinase
MMPSEATSHDLDWTRLQGTVLEGGLQLESILTADENEASFKVRVLGDSAANAFAKLFAAGGDGAEEQAAVWQSARELKSRHLSAPLGAGQTTMEGAPLLYVVLRRPDETLDAAIRERPLSRQEAGEVLLAAVRGLDELHAHGLVHGCVSPEQIVAVGDSIQLATECVRRAGMEPAPQLPRARYKAPESGAANVTPEEDVWCLGATLLEILTQQACGEDCMEAAAKLPAPFDTIARRCLEADPVARIKLGQVEALFRGRSAPAPRMQPPVSAAAPVAPAVITPASVAPPAARFEGAPVEGERATADPQQAPLRAWWIYAAAGIAVVLLLIWLFRPRHTPAPSSSQTAARTSTAATPAPQSAWESKTLTPEDKTPARTQPPSAQPAPAARQTDLVNGPVWRLVLYTYARQADADNKARWVNTKYPELNAETFSPSGGSPYLVVAGGRMSREDAQKLRQKARSLGLPHDAYIQNYQR